MNKQEQLMVIAMEECAELAQRISKALRFGMEQIQQDADDKPEENPERLTNRQRIQREYWDLRASLGLMMIDAWEITPESTRLEREKYLKIERYFERSRREGTLQD